MPTPAPFGAWISPISAMDVARSDIVPSWPDIVDDEVWWAESRPEEGGRIALVRYRPDGTCGDVLPPPWNARNRVHEYGGRPWCVLGQGGGLGLVFSHWDDQRLYRYEPHRPESPLRPLTPSPDRPAGVRYADPVVGPAGDEIWCVRETMTGPRPTDVRRDIVAVPIDGQGTDPGRVRSLAASHHFLTGPRVSPDGRWVTWVGWEHPNMPWDSTELCVAPVLDARTLGAHRVLAGGPTESVAQAVWAGPDLYALTDRTGWWNVYRIRLDGSPPVNVCPRDEEFGGPLWRIGSSWLAPFPDGRLAVLHGTHSQALGVLDPDGGTLVDLDGPYVEWGPYLATSGGSVAGIAGGPARPLVPVLADTESGTVRALRPDPPGTPEVAYLPLPEPRVFEGPGGRDVHAIVYPPASPDFVGPAGESPPYLVSAHGGPTGRAKMLLDLEIAFFTSRGIGVVDVNYGGSAGFGRAYRERLREQWGVVDVEDCAAVATALAREGMADGARLAIRGGSAGGWTAAASVTLVDTYRAAAIYFPVVDLSDWPGGTHDFESRYLDGLIGPWPAARDRYRERSPTARADRVRCPVLVLQGLEDVICPPSQAEAFLEAVREHGVPHAYLTFPGEQHGFRRAESIVASLSAELSLYGQVFGFEPPDVPRLELTA